MLKLRARTKEELNRAISKIVQKLSFEEKKELFDSILVEKAAETVPLSIFSAGIPGLEAVVLYLKNVQKKKVNEIARLLNRSRTTIYSTFYNTGKYSQGKLNKITKAVVAKESIAQESITKGSIAKEGVAKEKGKFDRIVDLAVPCSIFSNRDFSILESLVSYLRDEKKLSLVQISRELGKSSSTVKTVYWRYKKKCQQ